MKNFIAFCLIVGSTLVLADSERDYNKDLIEGIFGKFPDPMEVAPEDSLGQTLPLGSEIEFKSPLELSGFFEQRTPTSAFRVSTARADFCTAWKEFNLCCEAKAFFSEIPSAYSQKTTETFESGTRRVQMTLPSPTRWQVVEVGEGYRTQKDGVRISPVITTLRLLDAQENQIKLHCTLKVANASPEKWDSYISASALASLLDVVDRKGKPLPTAEIEEKKRSANRKYQVAEAKQNWGIFHIDAKRWPHLYQDRQGNLYSHALHQPYLHVYRITQTPREMASFDPEGAKALQEYLSSRKR